MEVNSFEFWIHPTARAAVAVYAVAIGDRLGMSETELRSLRLAVENPTLTGEDRLDCVLLFIEGMYRHNTLGQFPVPYSFVEAASAGKEIAKAYCEVARLIQPMPYRGED